MPNWLTEKLIERLKRENADPNARFNTLPDFTLPDAPDFGPQYNFDPSNPPFGAFTDFTPTSGIEDDLMSLLREKAMRNKITGIIPDRADWEASLGAQMDQIQNKMLGNREQFAAAVSARGISGSGEVPRQLYRDVMAPAVREAATVTAAANLDFSKFTSQAATAQEQLLAGSRAQLLDAAKTNAQLASAENMFGADMESKERMEANRNALTKSMNDDNITLETYKAQLTAQLSEYLSKMSWLTQTDVANIMGQWQAEAAKYQSKRSMWSAFGVMLAAWAKTGFAIPSDANLKENIHTSEAGLAEIIELAPKKFTWISGEGDDVGLIAQEVQEIMPDAVSRLPDSIHYGIKPMTIIAALVNSVKELKHEIDELKASK